MMKVKQSISQVLKITTTKGLKFLNKQFSLWDEYKEPQLAICFNLISSRLQRRLIVALLEERRVSPFQKLKINKFSHLHCKHLIVFIT